VSRERAESEFEGEVLRLEGGGVWGTLPDGQDLEALVRGSMLPYLSLSSSG
jgi:hypothetical protein